ncbi:hypothetical protein AKO1_007080 [Acrasis kona]|uniref:Uncharacterized protein n=1 Tax=Acrasis kona TaxID=1008807 RepID=A0AAW2YTZ2_9EUKA
MSERKGMFSAEIPNHEENKRYIMRITKEHNVFDDPQDYEEDGTPKYIRPGRQKKANIGVHPHRCDIRLEEFLWSVRRGGSVWDSAKKFAKCMASAPGEEPKDSLEYMDYFSYEYYMEMYDKGRIRDQFFKAGDFDNPNERYETKTKLLDHTSKTFWLEKKKLLIEKQKQKFYEEQQKGDNLANQPTEQSML